MKKNILVISATHGDEEFSIPVVKDLKTKYSFNWIIGNPKALKKKVRYLEADLNRSAPGNPKSLLYERRRASEIMKIAGNYEETVDLHGTNSRCGIFIILSDPSWENIELAKKFDVSNVLLWPSLKKEGPLTQIIRPGLELECGPKNDPKIASELKAILKSYLEGKKRKVRQKYYIVTGKLKGENDPELKDFVLTEKYGYPFYPIMPDNQYEGITCYMAQKLRDTL